MQQVFNTDSINCRKQILFNNWQLISLNSQIIGATGGYLSHEELVFLDECLAKYPKHYALLALHHHCLETQSIWMDTMIVANRQQLFATISSYPQVKAIVHGHIHQTLEAKVGTVQLWGTPSTCFQFKPKAKEFDLDDTSPGYRIIRLYDDGQIESEVIRLAEPLAGLQIHTHGY
jgi:3',5'-cyclic-AMP phosphodiesterase